MSYSSCYKLLFGAIAAQDPHGTATQKALLEMLRLLNRRLAADAPAASGAVPEGTSSYGAAPSEPRQGSDGDEGNRAVCVCVCVCVCVHIQL